MTRTDKIYGTILKGIIYIMKKEAIKQMKYVDKWSLRIFKVNETKKKAKTVAKQNKNIGARNSENTSRINAREIT